MTDVLTSTAAREIDWDNAIDVLDEISKFVFTGKYARYREDLKRRETWHEAVERVESMHLRKFTDLDGEHLDDLHRAFDQVRNKRVGPSMRALDVNTLLPTPDGWIKAGDVEPGQELFDQNGDVTRVQKTKHFEGKDLFDVYFSDGSFIRACGEHLWVTSTLDDRIETSKIQGARKTRVVTTEDIANSLTQGSGAHSKYNHAIWNPEPLSLREKDLPLDPYILGLWLGDGYSASGQFACHHDDMEIVESYTRAGFDAHKVSNNPHLWGTYGLETILREMGLLFNKHVPAMYLRSSYDQRLALVQGLMDSGGHTDKNGRSSFTNVSKPLVDAFCELVASLGIKYYVSIKEAEGNRQTKYTVYFHTTQDIHRLKRKLENQRDEFRASNSYRTITSVEHVGKGDAVCYVVDSPTRTFLAGEQMIVTHNSMQFGGKAVEVSNARQYNCAVRHMDSIRSFAEVFYLLLCGCGVGLGLSKKYINRLPFLVNENNKTGTVITYAVEDTIEGWADSVEALLNCYFVNTAYTGRKIVFDYSKIRPAGAPLKTSGGKAPGYKGLKAAHQKIKKLLDILIEERHQHRLKPIDAYDILMHVADAVLSGGVRRSATSVIFDKDDEDMINAKTGDWFNENPQRGRSNNSVLLVRGETSFEEFMEIFQRTKEWGEPGFVWAEDEDVLYNPCFEIGFRPVTEDGICGVQFCNLTTINGAKVETEEDFYEAAEAAAIIGTLQASYTHFPYLSHAAKDLTEQESLLGVSITAMMESADIVLDPEAQHKAARIVVDTNKKWARILGINPAARATTIKPEGTSTLVFGSMASGIHPAHAPIMFRRIQANKLDNVYQHFKAHNPHLCEESVWSANKTDDVIAFPVKVPEGTIVKSDLSAIEHLEIVKSTQRNWVNPGRNDFSDTGLSHNVSCTIKVKPDEWDEVAKYIYDNRGHFTAVSLISAAGDKEYQQAPNEEIVTEEDLMTFREYLYNFIPVDYSWMEEEEDNTDPQLEAACAGPEGCEVQTL